MVGQVMRKIKSIIFSPWMGLVGVILSLAGVAFAVYAFEHERKPNVRFALVAETDVLDVKQPVRELTVFFQNQDIQDKNLNLKAISLRVSNDGEADVLETYYASDVPWGFSVDAGRVIEAKLADSNSEYLMSTVQPTIQGDRFVQLRKTILERGKYFTINALVLHERSRIPVFTPIGKIAGNIPLVLEDATSRDKAPNFLQATFGGDTSIQFVRIVTYGVSFTVLLILALIATIFVTDRASAQVRGKREAHIAQLRKDRRLKESEQLEPLVKLYISEGPKDLRKLLDILRDDIKLSSEIKRLELNTPALKVVRNRKATTKARGDESADIEHERWLLSPADANSYIEYEGILFMHAPIDLALRSLVREGAVVRRQNTFSLSPEFASALLQFPLAD